jgi:hypothetical protein
MSDGPMTPSEELRTMLDERGIEYREYHLNPFEETTAWDLDVSDIRHEVCASFEEFDSGSTLLRFWNCTPEQAIAATLGPETCHDKNGFDLELGFECTVCGTMVDSYMVTTEDTGHRVQFNYCPCCGRRVVDE